MEIKYVEGLEVQQANEACIFKALRVQQQDFEHQLYCYQTVVKDLIVIPDGINESDKEVIMRMAGLGLDNQELLVLSVEYIGYRPAKLRNTKIVGDIDMTETGVSANETGKYNDKSMEIEDGVGAPDTVAAKSSDVSVESLRGVKGLESVSKITKTNTVATKSLDILVGGFKDASKITKTDIIAAKSLDVLVGGFKSAWSLESATKSAMMVIKR